MYHRHIPRRCPFFAAWNLTERTQEKKAHSDGKQGRKCGGKLQDSERAATPSDTYHAVVTADSPCIHAAKMLASHSWQESSCPSRSSWPDSYPHGVRHEGRDRTDLAHTPGINLQRRIWGSQSRERTSSGSCQCLEYGNQCTAPLCSTSFPAPSPAQRGQTYADLVRLLCIGRISSLARNASFI